MTITTNRTVDARHDGAVTNDTDPDPEVPERARGPRRFPAAYKARILAEYENLSKAEKGALLRREGLYSSLSPRGDANVTRAPKRLWAAAPVARRLIPVTRRSPG